MNIGAIVLTVRAHDARTAAYRLILPRYLIDAADSESILARRR
jgi:hypothetical protein